MARGISPETNLGANLGSATQVWNKLFVKDIEAESIAANSITMPSSGNAAYMNKLINSFTSPIDAHNGIYRGAEITDSWATIQSNVQAGDFSNYYIGDYKQITLTTNETVIVEIAGINNYKSWGNTAIGNHLDFISIDCLSTAYQFNTTPTNNGVSGDAYPWPHSALYQSLNGGSGVFGTLPSDLANVIDYKLEYVEQRYSSGGDVASDTGGEWALAKLWVPSEIEIYGHPTWSETGYGTAGFIQYPLFRHNPRRIVKRAGVGGARTRYWTISAHNASTTAFVIVGAEGMANFAPANTSSPEIRVPLCFRIA